jgi:hypothetical protein
MIGYAIPACSSRSIGSQRDNLRLVARALTSRSMLKRETNDVAIATLECTLTVDESL